MAILTAYCNGIIPSKEANQNKIWKTNPTAILGRKNGTFLGKTCGCQTQSQEKTVQLGSDNCAIVLSELGSEGHWRKLLKMIRKNRPLLPKEIANGRTKPSKLAQSLKKSGVTRFQTWWRKSLDS